MGRFEFFKQILGEDLSKLDEYECYSKAQEGNWDYQEGNYRSPKKALKYLDRAIQLNPLKVEAYTGRGLAYQKLKNFKLAIENFNEAISLEPTDDTFRDRSMCYLQAGHTQNALGDLTNAIKLNPNIINYGIRAGVYAALQEFKLSISDYNKIISMEPDNFGHYICRGYQYYELGEYLKALKDYDKANELEPNNDLINQYRELASEKLVGNESTCLNRGNSDFEVEDDDETVEDVEISSNANEVEAETNYKRPITLVQLAEGVVQIPHLPSELNQKAMDRLLYTFEIVDNEKKELLKVEYSAFCYSLMYLKYGVHIANDDKNKFKSFCESVRSHLVAYLHQTYGEEGFEKIDKIYSIRLKSYADAFYTENYSENISDIFREYIGLSLANGDLTDVPITAPVTRSLSPFIEAKIACAAVLADIWKFIDWHMEGWEIVDTTENEPETKTGGRKKPFDLNQLAQNLVVISHANNDINRRFKKQLIETLVADCDSLIDTASQETEIEYEYDMFHFLLLWLSYNAHLEKHSVNIAEEFKNITLKHLREHLEKISSKYADYLIPIYLMRLETYKNAFGKEGPFSETLSELFLFHIFHVVEFEKQCDFYVKTPVDQTAIQSYIFAKPLCLGITNELSVT